MNAAPWIFWSGFIGVHIGWYWLQQNYVPPEQRHEHPVVEWYLKYIKPKLKDN